MLNLISDPWIPVLRTSRTDTIRPDQIAEDDVHALNWPRADLNLACLEFLVGLTYLACPPASSARGAAPDAAALRRGLAPLKPAFNLLGDGPLFLQDFEVLEGRPNPPDMLFIDAAGDSTIKKNADLMVRRGRYQSLPLALAAMVLYTLQAFAPSGGAGNRTSMRGGGPMVTLVRPKDQGLWPMIWANVPPGEPLGAVGLNKLPWMRPTVTSEKEQVVTPPGDVGDPPHPEMFFGQPRRLRLVGNASGITGVIQRPHGTNYTQWQHDLSPYYRDKKGQMLPMHPKPGVFGYRNWRGILLDSEEGVKPETLRRYARDHHDGDSADLIVAGWAMDNMKPLDFLWSEQPIFPLSEEADLEAGYMVEAAERVGFALATNLRDAMGESDINKGSGAAVRQTFFIRTQNAFEAYIARLSTGETPDMTEWLTQMRKVALTLFDTQVIPALPLMADGQAKKAVQARRSLMATFAGQNKQGKKVYDALGLELPPKSTRPRREETT